MEKIPTLFKRDPENMRTVLSEIVPGCEWVLAGEGVATRKYDGTCVWLSGTGDWYARREVKPGKQPPPMFVAISTDPATGKTVGWEPIAQSPFAKFHAEAYGNGPTLNDPSYPHFQPGTTYELVGPKINGNPEVYETHTLVRHGMTVLEDVPRDHDGLRDWLLGHGYEGIVWHHPDGRMAKLKRRDFS